MYKELEGLVVEERGNSRAKGARAEGGKTVSQPGKNLGTHFAEGMVGNFHLQKPRTWMNFVVSVFGHGVVLAVLILLPLYFTQAINMPQFEKTLLVAPPPPPPPPPPAAVHVMPRVSKSFFTKGQLLAPKFIPKKVAEIREEAPPPAVSGVAGGVIWRSPGRATGRRARRHPGRHRSRAATASARSRRSQRALPRGRQSAGATLDPASRAGISAPCEAGESSGRRNH
jgi:hypothetical protein